MGENVLEARHCSDVRQIYPDEGKRRFAVLDEGDASLGDLP
jgi:hypothetical protein